MTIRFTGEDPQAEDSLAQAAELYRDVADEVFALIQRIKGGDWDARTATHAMKEMRAFYELVLEERAKVARKSKTEAGAVYDYALDLGAARAEIGRRLACLRDTGGG